MSERREPVSEKLHRKLTRVYLEAVRRRRLGLFETLTKTNEEEIKRLLEEEPRFDQRKENAPRRLLIDDEVSNALPEEFFENPTGWIENKPNIDRGFIAEEKESRPEKTYAMKEIFLYEDDIDIGRVKLLTLAPREGAPIRIVSKRLNPKKKDFEEVVRARQARAAGIPTPKVLAEIMDQGNLYAWFEYIPALDIDAVSTRVPNTGYFSHDQLLERIEHFASKLTSDQKKNIDNLLKVHGESIKREQLWNQHVLDQRRKVVESVNKKNQNLSDKMYSADVDRKDVLRYIEKIRNGLQSTVLPGDWFDDMKAAWPKLPSLDSLVDFLALDASRFVLGHIAFQTRMEIEGSYPNATGYIDLRHFSQCVYNAAAEIAEILTGTVFRDVNELYLETNAFRKECADRGFAIPEDEDRNILLRWDFEKDEPLRDERDKLQFVLIDLETPRY